MQTFDVGVYGPFKRYFNTACDSWMLSHPAKTITIYGVAELSGQAFGKAFPHCNITSSFEATGIYLINRNIFPDDVFLSAAVIDICVDVNTPATEPAPSTSQGSPAASASQGSPAASTRRGSPESSERHTPEDLWPCQKAAPRKPTATKRRKRKLAVITDTREKEELLNRRKENIVTKPKRAKKTCLPFAQDKHVDPDVSRPGTGYTDINNGMQDTGHGRGR